jgi:hypothetical protein
MHQVFGKCGLDRRLENAKLVSMQTTSPEPVGLSAETILSYVAHGYRDLCHKGEAGVCAVMPFLFTGGLITGLWEMGYKGRYCYETLGEALAALSVWDGSCDPPGSWIKYKGEDGERMGPGCIDIAA